ncbi:hypothetical protein WJX74_001815 [Apatococcus lobatus]|uniref:Mitochondrial import inner membrane translocase subunit TIM50 n=1 Tax=Apatococcus lobatus TaxID=904363 RepID=A0AAW1RGK3_9CHLO
MNRLVGQWRTVERAARSCNQAHRVRSGFQAAEAGTAAGSEAGPSSSTSRLFEKAASAIPPESSGASPAEPASAAQRALSIAGNALFVGVLGAASFFGYYTYMYSTDQVRVMVDETKKAENAFAGSQAWVYAMEWYAEQRQRLEDEIQKYSDPPSEQLLPELPPHARHVRTLVLDLDDTLIHSDWTRARGWRTFKRPGATAFIQQMASTYELVLYTDQLPTYADPIMDRLDPSRYALYRLYKDSTRYVNGRHVRDLSKLNRELGQVLLLTANEDAYQLQPDNAVKIKPWKLEQGDTVLLDLIPFLEAVVKNNVQDVRSVIKSYEGQDIPTAYRERMKQIQEQRKQAPSKSLFGFRK